MNIALSPMLEELIRRKIESGQYDSAGEVLQEALHLLDEREQVHQLQRSRLLTEIAKGVYQADNRQLVDFDEVLRGLHRKTAAVTE